MVHQTHQERETARELGKEKADDLLEFLQYTDHLDGLFAAKGIAGSIALACENGSLNHNDVNDIQQAARGIQYLLDKFYDIFETIPAPKYVAANA